LKFGIWVEPERVNLSMVGDGDVDESWLATSGGSYESDHSAQVCLAGAAGRQWVVDKLSRLIDEVQPDYLKWDNNLWVNCDRPGHDHGSTDGSFAHISALYQILDNLRQRYPNLLIENCSGGGNRMDFGMLRYSDAGWMDDRSAPSVHVRHNIEGLSTVFPPAYLLSFVLDQDTEPLHDAPDLSMYFRSRMGGALGLCFRSAEFSGADVENISHEIAIYKTMRATLSVAAAALLSPQASLIGGPDWDVMQASAPGSNALVLYAYQNDQGGDRVNIRPTGLQGDAIYEVSSVDRGFLGTATGADIMANGIDIIKSPATSAHILTMTAPR
jgi:alpha-galactosidase